MIKVQLSKKTTITLSEREVRNMVTFGLAVLVSVFCLMGVKTLLSKTLYQQKVISASHKADSQLTTNLKNSTKLANQYTSLFENTDPENVLGHNNNTSAQAVPPDVDNARIAADTLPTIYDYPATIASVTKILTDDGISTPSITGTDESSKISNDPSSNPSVVTITLGISGTGSYPSIQRVLKDLERSIRPFDVTDLELSGNASHLTLNATVNTYFQPATVLGITPKEVH